MRENKVKILTLDLETSPISAYTWGPKFDTNLIEIKEQSNIICYSAKWYNGKQYTFALPDFEGYKKGTVDDKNLVLSLHKFVDDADIIVTQNGVDFDIRVMNARFVKHGLKPPSPYKVVDTKKEAKRYLRLPSNSLNDMGDYFGLGQKLHTDFGLWKQCMAGDEKAWKLMKKYNAQDVKLTELIYEKLRPYMKTHPSTDIYEEKGTCPRCGSLNIHSRGYLVNNTTKYHRAQCRDCGGWYRYGKNLHINAIPNKNI